MTNIIEEIEKIDHLRHVKCMKCGCGITIPIQDVYVICEKCGQRAKVRGFASIGTEIEDVVEAVLELLADEPSANMLLEKYAALVAKERALDSVDTSDDSE